MKTVKTLTETQNSRGHAQYRFHKMDSSQLLFVRFCSKFHTGQISYSIWSELGQMLIWISQKCGFSARIPRSHSQNDEDLMTSYRHYCQHLLQMSTTSCFQSQIGACNILLKITSTSEWLLMIEIPQVTKNAAILNLLGKERRRTRFM